MKKITIRILLIILIAVAAAVAAFYIYKFKTTEYLDLDNLVGSCRIVRTCNDLVGVDCNSAADGPFYYVNKNNNKIVGFCGGICMEHGCNEGCPPKEWTCNN